MKRCGPAREENWNGWFGLDALGGQFRELSCPWNRQRPIEFEAKCVFDGAVTRSGDSSAPFDAKK